MKKEKKAALNVEYSDLGTFVSFLKDEFFRYFPLKEIHYLNTVLKNTADIISIWNLPDDNKKHNFLILTCDYADLYAEYQDFPDVSKDILPKFYQHVGVEKTGIAGIGIFSKESQIQIYLQCDDKNIINYFKGETK